MGKIKIVCDSSAGLTEEEIKKYDITVIPLTVMIDGTVYVWNGKQLLMTSSQN